MTCSLRILGLALFVSTVSFNTLSFNTLSFGAEPLAAQSKDGERGGRKPARHDNGRGQRDHWKRLDPTKRREIEKLYESLEALPKERREALLARLREMSAEKRRATIQEARKRAEKSPFKRLEEQHRRNVLRQTWEGLSPELREKLERMPRDKRHEPLEKIFGERRRRLLEGLPEDVRKTIEGLDRRGQTDFLRRRHADQRNKKIFSDEEVETIRRLPHRQLRRMLGPRRRGPVRGEAAGPGLPGPGSREGRPNAAGSTRTGPRPPAKDHPKMVRPDFISEASWRRWQKLEPSERYRVVRGLSGEFRPRGARPSRGGPPDGRGSRGSGPPHAKRPGDRRPSDAKRPGDRRPSGAKRPGDRRPSDAERPKRRADRRPERS